MGLTTAQLATLKTELQNDPRGYGFAALLSPSENDTGIATVLNLIRDGTAGTVPTTPTGAGGVASGIITVKRKDMTSKEVREAFDVRDFIASANNLQAAWFQSVLLSTDRIQLTTLSGTNSVDTLMFANIKLASTNANGSQTRLAAAATRPGSRAEEMFGVGTFIADIEVANALRP
jgi:hypothetical protein